MKNTLFVVLFFFTCIPVHVEAQEGLSFQKPPKEILDLADIDAPPAITRDRFNKYLVTYNRSYYKTLDELAAEELKLGGLRMNPANHNQSRTRTYTGLSFKDFSTLKDIPVSGLPSPLKMEYAMFSPNSSYFTFVQITDTGLELWLVDIKNGKAKKLTDGILTAVLGWPYIWSKDEKEIYFRKRMHTESYKAVKLMATGPAIQEATGTKSAARTFQDLLKNPQDEEVFDYFAVCSVEKVSVETGSVSSFLRPAIYKSLSLSPDGKYLLTSEVQKPYSYQLPYQRFPYKVMIYDRTGKMVKLLVNKPLLDKIPQGFDATETGMRDIFWLGNEPATLMYAEAQDEGDPANKVEWRDHVFTWTAPFTETAKLFTRVKNRFSGITPGKNEYIVEDYWWKTRNSVTYYLNKTDVGKEGSVLSDRSSEDLYSDPGNFVTWISASGMDELLYSKDGKKIYLQGEGYGPQGNRPFIDEFILATKKTKRIWQADGKSTYESIVDVIDLEKKILLTRIESPTQYPNYYIRTMGKGSPKQITFLKNPFMAIEKITKKKIYYKRKDGVQLSATMYLPAGYDAKRDGKLPVLLHAYPTEFKDDKAAGQVKESPFRFTSLFWASPVYWVTRGYCILDDAQFPIVGKGDQEPNDTYVEQLVANAEAAIHAVDSMGVGDPKRCAAMGHSYGAFMTANLLAHCDLFAAGIARSGAYNRTLTPFGFQAEERYFWDVPNIYAAMSPFNNANKINEPLLLIHGDADNNPGTFTLQSERLFQAVKGLGGKARLVLLPYESHSYAARENILHMLWEMDQWLETHVKNKK
ncbi:MAG: prolyl oligopeptidase family serine peptidase [Flavobacteriales bacterium]